MTDIQEVFDYRDGHLIWKISPGYKIKVGDIAGSVNKDGYLQTKYKGKNRVIHQLVWEWFGNKIPDGYVLDHIDTNPLNNKIDNLRLATPSQNQHNRSLNKNNTSGVKGVCWNIRHKKWLARVRFNYVNKNLGYYEDLELAELVVQEARDKFHGTFARHK